MYLIMYEDGKPLRVLSFIPLFYSCMGGLYHPEPVSRPPLPFA